MEMDLKRDRAPEGDAGSALGALRELIAEHAATPGLSLPTERDLAARFGVGRRAIRRGLAVLEAEGRIWRRQGKGTFIGPAAAVTAPSLGRLSSRTNFFEVMEVRLHIEPTLARLASLRARPDQIAMLRRLGKRSREAPHNDAAALEHWDGAFHRCIAEAAGNHLFLDLFAVVDTIRRDPLWERYRAKARTPEGLALSEQQHADLVEAIADRAPAQAAAVMREHIKCLQVALAGALELELAHDD